MGAQLGSLRSLLGHSDLAELQLLQLLEFDSSLALFLDLAAHLLLVLTLLLGKFALKPVTLLLELALTHFLSLLFLQVSDQALTGDVLALEALPDAIGHAL